MPSPWIPTGGGGGVTAVTGTPPIASSGGSTPDISISTAGLVTDVTASAPLASTGGQTPDISIDTSGFVIDVTGSAPITSTGGATPDIGIDPTAFNFSPVSYQYWISQLAPAGGNGSIKQPLNAVSDAITLAAALPAGSVIDYFCADTDYSAEGILIFPTGKHHRVISMGGGSTFGSSTINLVCGVAPTALTMVDFVTTGGIGLTGNGDATINLIGTVKDACDISVVDTSVMSGGDVIINAVNARYSVSGNTRCIQIQNLNCTVGNVDANNAAYSHIGGACTGAVSIRTIGNLNNDSPGVVGCELFGNWTVTAASAGFLAGFQSCLWNGALAPPVFIGPAGSFTSDIQSAYSFALQGGSLFGGATSSFTDAGYEGFVLEIVGGFPTFVAPSAGGVTDVTGSAPIASTSGATPDISISPATTSDPGSMSAADKTKLDYLNVAEIDDGNSGTADNIDWSAGPAHKSTVTGNVTYTFTGNPPVVGFVAKLRLVIGGAGGFTITWPASVKWQGGAPPTWVTTVGAINFASFYWDGTNYLGAGSTGFA